MHERTELLIKDLTPYKKAIWTKGLMKAKKIKNK